ncbi:3-isopropylmalate dehydratase [Sciscionella sediminilitoris]|uniref:LeuD/DmdB family oxidoreductase small subunit n=1 Tax=Sciscionella sediminilitoris TaxID=1445613 RepID=UPI0004DF5B28|nr:3-isopropylmalate dehydratase [Sciscionella sp. SE31]
MTTEIEGRVWVVDDSVNTDAMYPGFAMKLSHEEAARHVFYELRPGWTEQVREGDIVVAGNNFGVGSSRPVARLLRILGVRALLANEFNSLFYRNCINYGLPALTVPGVRAAFNDGERARLDIGTGQVENLDTGAHFSVPGLPAMLTGILDAGGLIPRLSRDGYLPSGAYE